MMRWFGTSLVLHGCFAAWGLTSPMETLPPPPEKPRLRQIALLQVPAPAKVVAPAPAPTPRPRPRPRPRPVVKKRPVPVTPEPSPIPAPPPEVETPPEPPPPSPAPVAPATPPAPDEDDLLAKYARQVSALIDSRKTYPLALRRARIRGRLVLAVAVMADGTVGTTRVVASSGHRLLDRNALRTVTRIQQLPSPPEALAWRDGREIRVPMHYRLTR